MFCLHTKVSKKNNDISRWIETYDHIVWIDDLPWVLQNRILEPVHMPHTIRNINREKIRKALKSTNALFAYWTDHWNSSESEWWWTICDNHDYDIESIENARGRRGIRKGLKECSVKRLEPTEFIDLTYDIFLTSIKSYGHKVIPMKSDYKTDILKKSAFKGYELWGAFVNDQIAAFATCVVIDDAVILGSTKSNPALNKYSPNNALFYQITKHYLRERGVKYVSNGARTLLHTTSINDFLIRMGYRKNYCRLNIELSNSSNMIYQIGKTGIFKILNFLKNISPEKFSGLEAFIKLVQISKTF